MTRESGTIRLRTYVNTEDHARLCWWYVYYYTGRLHMCVPSLVYGMHVRISRFLDRKVITLTLCGDQWYDLSQAVVELTHHY